MLELFFKGGPLMYPIVGCSVLALAIFMERVWTFSVVRRQSAPVMQQIKEKVAAGDRQGALSLCAAGKGPLVRILASALRSDSTSRDQLKDLVEEVGGREGMFLDRYLGLLGTIATIAPLLGLLGTVLGMIKAFTTLAAEGVGTPATLGIGISEALITTAAGLSLAIPVILMHRYLTSRSERVLIELEEFSMHVVDEISR